MKIVKIRFINKIDEEFYIYANNFVVYLTERMKSLSKKKTERMKKTCIASMFSIKSIINEFYSLKLRQIQNL
jgi:hypothetical protein